MREVKVLHICPLWFPIAADSPGGIETLLYRLIVELEKLGCRNTLLASGDSSHVGQRVPVVAVNIRDQMQAGTALEYDYYQQHQLWMALEMASGFEVIHSHVGSSGYLLSAMKALRPRTLHTIHTPIYADHTWFIREHPDIWLSTVSEFQAAKLWPSGTLKCRVIHSGIDVEQFSFGPGPNENLLFIGRMERHKGPDLAVQVALELRLPLVLAGPIVDEKFFETTVRPYLSDRIRYVGVVNHREKNQLYRNAACAILPFRGEEGFGLVAVEAMACGTPVVSLANGALPEIIEDGRTGFLARDPGELSSLVIRAAELDRAQVRSRVAERFHVAASARAYAGLYREMLAAG